MENLKDCWGDVMNIMTVNGREYRVLNLLGKGKGGYSYLATDGDHYFVLKQIHHEPCDYYEFGNKMKSELQDYKCLTNVGIRIPRLIEADVENERILKEYIRGETVYELVLKDENVDKYIEQVREMCRLLYPNNLNIDYFPTNFVVTNELLYYVDYECNRFMDKWSFENWGIKYWSKTPEFLEYAEKHK